jgi:hypothetical protein
MVTFSKAGNRIVMQSGLMQDSGRSYALLDGLMCSFAFFLMIDGKHFENPFAPSTVLIFFLELDEQESPALITEPGFRAGHLLELPIKSNS